MRKNIPLEDKIRFRNKLEYISFDLDTQLKKMRILAKNEKLEKRHFCLYNHLTPNRNLMGYDYHFSHFTNLEQISHYYDKIYAYDFSLNNIHINEN